MGRGLQKVILLVSMLKVDLDLISIVPTLRCGVATIQEMAWLWVNAAPKSARLSVKTRTRKRTKKVERKLKGSAKLKGKPMRSLERKQKKKGRRKRKRMSGLRSVRGK